MQVPNTCKVWADDMRDVPSLTKTPQGELVAKYKVTGVLVSGRRFKAIHTDNYYHAMGINLYRGTVWGKGEDGRWHKIKVVWN